MTTTDIQVQGSGFDRTRLRALAPIAVFDIADRWRSPGCCASPGRTHGARLMLMEGSVPTAVFGLVSLGSLLTAEPLLYRIALQTLGGGTAARRDLEARLSQPGMARAFRTVTLIWGVTFLAQRWHRTPGAFTTKPHVGGAAPSTASGRTQSCAALSTCRLGRRRCEAVRVRPECSALDHAERDGAATRDARDGSDRGCPNARFVPGMQPRSGP
jgi:hypothetical protein